MLYGREMKSLQHGLICHSLRFLISIWFHFFIKVASSLQIFIFNTQFPSFEGFCKGEKKKVDWKLDFCTGNQTFWGFKVLQFFASNSNRILASKVQMRLPSMSRYDIWTKCCWIEKLSVMFNTIWEQLSRLSFTETIWVEFWYCAEWNCFKLL